MRISYVLVSVALLLASSGAGAFTTDGTINSDEIPTLPLTQALAKAVLSLGTNPQGFVCTSAFSKKQEFGGGWGFFFRSRGHNTRFIEINGKGNTVANNEASPKGGQFKKAPALSTEKAAAVAIAARQDAVSWRVIGIAWIEEQDQWQVHLLNNQKQTITVVVDSKEKTKE